MTDKNTQTVFTVSQLNEYVKMLIDGNPMLKRVSVKGELSNVKRYPSGHIYFSLKDESGAVLSAVMYSFNAEKLRFELENGMKVIASGKVSVYVRDGKYQLFTDDIQPDGIGALYLAFEQLKQKLSAEGLFDVAHKKPLPKIPKRIGVITSSAGAAVRDIINVTGRRFPFAEIIIFPSLVQGDGAAEMLRGGIEYFNEKNDVDVIIIGRGGGSMEDLWAFNDETLARAIYRSHIPVISAVGHEVDFTICDFVADLRAPTPSAAAECAVPQTKEVIGWFNNIITLRCLPSVEKKLDGYRKALERISSSRALTSPTAYIDEQRERLAMDERELIGNFRLILKDRKNDFISLSKSLEALNPLSVLNRGYCAALDEVGNVVKSVKQIKTNDRISLLFGDGEAVAGVVEIKEKGIQKNGE